MPAFGGPASFGGGSLDAAARADIEGAAVGAMRLGAPLDDFSDWQAWKAYTGTTPTIAVGGDSIQPLAVKMTTPVGTAAAIERPLAFSMVGRFLSFRIKADANTSVIRIHFTVKGRSYSRRIESRDLIREWHLLPGEWVTQTVSVAEMTGVGTGVVVPADFDAISGVWIQATPTGGTATTVEFADMRLHDLLLEPGVVWTFDDGQISNLTQAAPALAASGQTGVAYINSNRVGTTGLMTLAQVQELKAAGWTIGGHGHNHASLDFTDVTLDSELSLCYDYLVDNDLLRGGAHLAYPSGVQTPASQRAAMRYFRTAALASAHVSETPVVAQRSRLRRLPMQGPTTPTQAKVLLDRIKASGEVAIVMLHDLQTSGPDFAHNWLTSSFAETVAYAASIGLRNYSLDEVFPGAT